MLGAVGVLLAKTGVLDPHGRKTLSKLIYFVFTPCLTFAKLAPVLTARTFVLWMPLAINMFFSVAVGLLLGVLLVLLVRPPAGFSKHVIVTTGLGNAGNLPLVLVAALMRSSGSTLFAGQDVSVDLAIAYVAVGIFAATVTHFTIGTQLLKAPGSKAAGQHAGGAAASAAAGNLTSPPLVGCMLAVGVGMLPLLRHQLFSPGGHLLLVQDCIAMFGDCCIPSLMLMLGATLAKGPGRCCPPLRVVLGVTAARLLLLPLLGTGWLLLASKAGWLLAPDSVFLLVMLIQNSVPTALNVHTLATLNSNREEEVGALLFWQYLASCITTPAWLMFYTWLLKSGAFAVAA
ncbi:hypothetical protein OEZ86_010972 [Tetradesmus obliquus]|nr:hypothetical protein OEZ86_010972 [Tetradesmus obliquus]